MNRTSLTYLIVGLLIGGLVTGGIDASALTSPDSAETAGAAAAAVAPAAAKKKKTTTKQQEAAKKKKAAAKKKAAKKKKAKKKKRKPAPVAPPAGAGIPLVGLFKYNAGGYSGGRATGSHVRLVLPGGSVERGPYFANPNSKGGSYTLISPGGEGGLKTGAYQEPPSPAFGKSGDALVNRIMVPQPFAFIRYSASTSPKDPQTGVDVPAPSITVTGGQLSGDLRSFSASWNKQFFNQGSPKPDGSSPGLTRPVSGTYNAETKAFTLDWTSQIVGGPFNNFTGVWHLEGVFEPRCG
jgi:hypothetical protein